MAGVVVEFAGLPGAGKSTLAECTRAAIVKAGMPCVIADAGISARVATPVRVRRRLALAGAEACQHPLRGAEALRAMRRAAPGLSRNAVAGAAQWFAVQRIVAQAGRSPGVHLLDEGPVQTLWTLALRTGRDPASLTGATADLLVVVDVPVEVVSARLAARSSRHSRTQLLPERERVAELVTGLGLLRDILATQGRPHLLLVNDGRHTPDELGRRAATWVLRAGP